MACPDCGKPTRYERVFVTMWLGAELNVIDDVPAHVCSDCGQQSYDRAVEVAGERGGAGPDVSREGVQRDLLPIVEGSAWP